MDHKLPPNMEAKNNKETINLLDLLSDSESAISDIVQLTPRKKKVKRRYKSGVSIREKRDGSCGCSKSQTRAVVLWLAAVLITLWLLALSWLAAVLYSDIRKMDANIRSVIAGSANVQDTLHECHSQSKDLLNNQTTIFTRLNDINLQITNFTTQLSNIQHELHDVQESLRAAPELVDVPKKLNSLLGEVGTFGSQIRDLGATVNSMKEANTRIQNVQNNLLQNVTTMEHSLSELSKITLQQPQVVLSNESKVQSELMSSTISELTTNLTRVNETLTRRIDWVAADLAKYHKILLSAQDMAINVSTQVSTLEGRCAKHSEQKVLQESINQLVEDVKLTRVKDLEVSQKLKNLEDSYNSLKNSSDTMLASVAELRKSKSNEIVQTNNSIKEILGNDNPAGDSSPTSTISRVTAQEEMVTGSPGPSKDVEPGSPLPTPA
ncbi:kinesin-like protein KIN-14D isoform X2 [Athalia rosae]|uniref:kinesin-like protein KIN-14D isoform X2 n=1 Tax=Athalia rosae TaxID=37344 RepID=UPI002033637C|nr:kinesin-like protein KIN-14D isoform X2 [Athalia rosae]